MLFRTQDNVPEFYVNGSRDFQLLCRLKDVIFGGVKYTIDSLNHTSNTMEINATLLPLLKTKLGFFEYEELTEDELRYLLTGFADLVKYKGSKKSIEKAIFLWFRVHRIPGKLLDININNENYTVNISINAADTDTKILDEIFKYILPAGYTVNYKFAFDQIEETEVDFNDKYEGITINNYLNSNIRSNYIEDALLNRLVGAVGFTQIMTADDLSQNNQDPDKDKIKDIKDGTILWPKQE